MGKSDVIRAARERQFLTVNGVMAIGYPYGNKMCPDFYITPYFKSQFQVNRRERKIIMLLEDNIGTKFTSYTGKC